VSDKPEPAAEATEVEALATLLERGSDHHGADCDRAAAMLRALAARLAVAERDTKRLDWINANACAEQRHVCGDLIWTFATPDSEDASVRAAIDAALSEEPRNE